MPDAAAMPLDETARQRALDAFHIVDTLPEGAYDDIVRVAAALCHAPIALITLLDRDRQWFKAAVGMDRRETPRDLAVCDVAIRTPDRLMEVPDLQQDARFAAFPMVAAGDARFYAGMPLVTDTGAAIGTVCVVDQEPRQLDSAQRDALAALARITMRLLDARLHDHDAEVTRTMQAALPDAQPAASPAPYTFAVLQLQDYAEWVIVDRERGVELRLQQLDRQLERALRDLPDASATRTTDDIEYIVVLPGDDNTAALRDIQECLDAFRAETGRTVLMGSVQARQGDRTHDVYLRAEEALSMAKDAWHAARENEDHSGSV